MLRRANQEAEAKSKKGEPKGLYDPRTGSVRSVSLVDNSTQYTVLCVYVQFFSRSKTTKDKDFFIS